LEYNLPAGRQGSWPLYPDYERGLILIKVHGDKAIQATNRGAEDEVALPNQFFWMPQKP
jgi:hypothetical protein